MTRDKEIETIVRDIQELLKELESVFFNVFVAPIYYGDEPEERSIYTNYLEDDNETWLFHGTRRLYYKICYFLELKNVPIYLSMFRETFSSKIDNQEKVLESYRGLYNDDEPSMIIHDRIRDFLSALPEFHDEKLLKPEGNKLKMILENTNFVLAKTKTKVTNETSIYRPVKWFVDLVYPTTRRLGKARFIEQFTTYHPDILVPELNTAIEYKFIKKGSNIESYLTQLKTDADCYKGDPEYRFFYAIIYFEDKGEINLSAFSNAIREKEFPENWIILPV
jgi:hypothetical protein